MHLYLLFVFCSKWLISRFSKRIKMHMSIFFSLCVFPVITKLRISSLPHFVVDLVLQLHKSNKVSDTKSYINPLQQSQYLLLFNNFLFVMWFHITVHSINVFAASVSRVDGDRLVNKLFAAFHQIEKYIQETNDHKVQNPVDQQVGGSWSECNTKTLISHFTCNH